MCSGFILGEVACRRWRDGVSPVDILKITARFVESEVNTIPVKSEQATSRLHSFCSWSLPLSIRIFLCERERVPRGALEPASRVEHLANKYTNCVHACGGWESYPYHEGEKRGKKSRLINENKREREDKDLWSRDLQAPGTMHICSKTTNPQSS